MEVFGPFGSASFLVINIDATSNKLSEEENVKSKTVVVTKQQKDNQGAGAFKTSEGSGTAMAFFVKWFAIIASDGSVGPNVLCIADSNLPAEDFYVHEVRGGHHNLNGGVPSQVAYVCIMKSRTPNKKFYRWLFKTIVFEFVLYLRDAYGLPKDMPAAVLLDGELVQIREFMDGDDENSQEKASKREQREKNKNLEAENAELRQKLEKCQELVGLLEEKACRDCKPHFPSDLVSALDGLRGKKRGREEVTVLSAAEKESVEQDILSGIGGSTSRSGRPRKLSKRFT